MPPLIDAVALPPPLPLHVRLLPVTVNNNALGCVMVAVPTFVQPFASVMVTVYVPADKLLMVWVVAPVLHRYPLAPVEVSITLPPGQNVSGPLAVMTGMAEGLMVTKAAADVPAQMPVAVTV
jgi:hypothetical protein